MYNHARGTTEMCRSDDRVADRISTMSRYEIVVPDGVIRVRLEEFLFDYFGGLSRMYLRDVIKSGACEVNGCAENRGFRVRAGDLIEIAVDAERENSMRPENISLDIVFEDDQLIVINKPARMLVHPTHRDKNGTLLNGLSYYLNGNGRFSGNEVVSIRPGLVHRLDRETSGLIIVAKARSAHKELARQFQKRSVEKLYIARVEGMIHADSGTIESPIGRYADKQLWDVKDDGKHSITRFRVLDRSADATLLNLQPITGRTNQLRVHCASIGHPIVGDVKRGGRPYRRLCLHACRLSFRHPVSGETITLQTEPDFGLDQ